MCRKEAWASQKPSRYEEGSSDLALSSFMPEKLMIVLVLPLGLHQKQGCEHL